MTRILVIRREDDFSRMLMANGLSVINCPVIRTEPLADLSGLENTVSRLDRFDGIFITSATAAEIFARHAVSQLRTYRGRVFVLGCRSFDILKDIVADIVFDETANTAGKMVDAIADGVSGRRLLFVRGERSLLTIPERLDGEVDVEEAIVYRTVDIAVEDAEKEAIRKESACGTIAMACFFSPSGVESFVKQFGIDILRSTQIAAIGETTKSALRNLDLKVDVVSKRTDSKHFAAAVLEHLNTAVQRSSV